MTSPRLGSVPVTTNVSLVFVLARELPLSPAEHDVVMDVQARGQRRRWRRVQDLDIAGLDGFGRHRVVARIRLLSPDLDLVDLPRVAELLDELDAAVPAGKLSARDPLALFGRRGGHVSWDGHHLLPALPAGWHEPACCRLQGTDQAPNPGVVIPPPATEAELADMLELVDLDGASPSALTAGAAGALRHLPAVRAALFGGTRPGGACRVFAALAERGLADRDALIQGARAVLADGDARERASAQTLLTSLGA
ncbi:MAG: DUF190 domain-containing protein, partial [Oligoflexia bacterium]|nr:DUF190 domain-containing protein [Oligoflexia bacterium]